MGPWGRWWWTWFTLAAVLGASATAQTLSTVQTTATAADARAGHLRRGVNLSMWYAQRPGDYTAARLAGYVTTDDMRLIRRLGFDHVRLPVDPVPLTLDAGRGTLRPEALAHLDDTVRQLRAAGLNVVLDLHPEEDWKTHALTDADGPARLEAFWVGFAAAFAQTDPEHVFFELLNEPTSGEPRWEAIQAHLVERVRAVAPRHTLLVTASMYSKAEGLEALQPLPDRNLIYTFHFYDPMYFTHQGATWGMAEWGPLRGVPYPSTPENVRAAHDREPNPRTRDGLEHYGAERWDAERIAKQMAAVSAWGRRQRVPLYCGEFGVYKLYAAPADRAQWIHDARTALEGERIGWAMWDYETEFGLVSKGGAAGTILDSQVTAALGMSSR